LDLRGSGRRLEKIHSEGLHNVHSSPHIVNAIKSSRMRRASHATYLEKCTQYFLMENLKQRDHFEDLATDRRIILELMLQK
jgi:hypothetical protein